ncbi:hypothetical protein KR044_010240 [Drosophila immigrans]|nr:hypothetical protein KR044_010240 [Drosophila immigrans]
MWQGKVSTLLLLLGVPSWTISLTLQETLQLSYQEQPFETLLLLQHRRQLECNEMKQVAATGNWPMLRLSNEADFYLRSSQSSEMLALICLTESRTMNWEMWQALATNLNNMRQVRVLLVLQEEHPVQQLLQELTVITQQLSFPHVVLLATSGQLFRLQPYAQQSWLRIRRNRSRPIFGSLNNFHLLVARTLPDQMSSRSLVYKDKQTGKQKFTGFVARLITEFAMKHNISLQMQREVAVGEKFPLVLLRNMTLNGTLNLPMTLCGFEVSSALGIYSYPFDMPSWFIMVPCAREISTAQVYLLLWNWKMLTLSIFSYTVFALLDTALGCLLRGNSFSWSSLLFNERMISGILGQAVSYRPNSTLSSRVIQAQLFIVGLLISTLFAAHLNTLLTKRPTEKPIANFQQLKQSQLKVNFEESESFYLHRALPSSELRHIASQMDYLPAKQFFSQRNQNSSSAFSMTSTEWIIIKRQQEVFHQPVQCFHRDLIFHMNLLMSVPLEANSIFGPALDAFIQRIHPSGLMSYWKDESLMDLIALGQISLKDPYEHVPFHEFKVADLFWVWLIVLLGLLLASIAFICELLTYRGMSSMG